MESGSRPSLSPWMSLRVVALDLTLIWVLISFFRLFIVENYRIPTGSMTPTLVGGRIAQLDVDGDQDLDYVLARPPEYDLFINSGAGYLPTPHQSLSRELRQRVESQARNRHDHILVSKIAYWFRPPDRGDIAVFKVPERIFDRLAPIYVKRVAGLPGESVDIRENRLTVDGKKVDSPAFFAGQYYEGRSNPYLLPIALQPHEVLFLGDNTFNSSDGRVWGACPAENIKGRVFFRYLPLRYFGFVR